MFNEYFYPFCSWIYSFVLRDSGFNSEDECPPSIISCPYARMGCQTKVKKNKVVDVKSKVLHGCFQDIDEITRKYMNPAVHTSMHATAF